MDRRINQTDEACTLRAPIASRCQASSSPTLVGRRVFEIECDDSQAGSKHVDFHNCAERCGCGRADQARSSRHARAGMCVSLRERSAERSTMERLAHRLDCGLCASLIAELANATPRHFPLLSQPTFQICLLSRGLERRTKNPGLAGMINEGSGREREARWRWHFPPASMAENARGPRVHLLRPIGTAGNVVCAERARERTQRHHSSRCRTSPRSFRASFRTMRSLYDVVIPRGNIRSDTKFR